jgi:hypothetical protein
MAMETVARKGSSPTKHLTPTTIRRSVHETAHKTTSEWQAAFLEVRPVELSHLLPDHAGPLPPPQPEVY